MAARNGHKINVQLHHDEWGATKVEWVMTVTTSGGHETFVRLCHDEWDAAKVEWAIIKAAKYRVVV